MDEIDDAAITGEQGVEVEPTITGQEGSDSGEQLSDLAVLQRELATNKKRYADSSREGKRLNEELIKAQARLEALERQSSLKEQSQQTQQQGFVNKDTYVETWVKKGIPQEAADFMYERDRAQYEDAMFHRTQVAALTNRLKFAEENSSRLAVMSNPDIKKAVDFWADDPVASALPPSEQKARYDAVVKKLGVRVEGRDTTSIKGAAGSPVGGAGRGGGAPATSEMDARAKEAGFTSYKAMMEIASNPNMTQAQYAEWERKYKGRN